MLDQSRLYAQVLALRQQLRERVPQVERVVTSLRKWAASHEPESPSRKVAERALADLDAWRLAYRGFGQQGRVGWSAAGASSPRRVLGNQQWQPA